MALSWLDAARYADSNGFQQDGDTWQWIWRDWVVKALNADMPFDRFSTEQLAGDLLPPAATDQATTDQKIASGFNRNHLLNGEGGAIAEEQRFNNLFDRVDTTSTTWLGLTMACAQCHDHKYDPMTQHDYYALLDAFNRVPESGVPTRFSARIRVAPPVIELPVTSAGTTSNCGRRRSRRRLARTERTSTSSAGRSGSQLIESCTGAAPAEARSRATSQWRLMSSTAGPERPKWVHSVLPVQAVIRLPVAELNTSSAGSVSPEKSVIQWPAGRSSGTSAGTIGCVSECPSAAASASPPPSDPDLGSDRPPVQRITRPARKGPADVSR